MNFQRTQKYFGNLFQDAFARMSRSATPSRAMPQTSWHQGGHSASIPRSFESARQSHPLFSGMNAGTRGTALPQADIAASFASAFAARGDARYLPAAEPNADIAACLTAAMSAQHFETTPAHSFFSGPESQHAGAIDPGAYQHILDVSMTQYMDFLNQKTEELASQISTILENMSRNATEAYMQALAEQAANQPPQFFQADAGLQHDEAPPAQPDQQQQSYDPQPPQPGQDHDKPRPAQQDHGPAAARARRTAPAHPDMSIREQRDSAGWSDYVQRLKTRHGWTDAKIAQWVLDFKSYIKFGDAKSATAFNDKYGTLMQGKVEDSEVRANFTRLLKAMSKSLKAEAAPAG